MGNGSGLINLNPASLTPGTAGINITGNAATATLATIANDALNLGGLPPNAYAPASGSPNYAPAGSLAGYVAKAGDTMTGALNLPADGLVAGTSQLVIVGANANFDRDAIGMGTSTPTADLHVSKNLHGQLSLVKIENTGPFSAAGLELKAASTDNANDWTLVAQDKGSGATDGMQIQNSSAGVALEIAPGTLNIGIGTQTPSQKLDVAGNIRASGGVTAASFSGNGAGLTGVNSTGLSCAGCVGNTQLGVAYAGSGSQGGPANSALSALSASQATNSLSLGGQLASNYARLDVANSFTGNQSVAGNLATTGTVAIGSAGTPILKHLSLAFNPLFPALKNAACSSANFTFTGASDGDTIALGVPNARMTGGGTLNYFAWVSAANTITIRACNIDPTVKQTTAGSGAIRVDVWKH